MIFYSSKLPHIFYEARGIVFGNMTYLLPSALQYYEYFLQNKGLSKDEIYVSKCSVCVLGEIVPGLLTLKTPVQKFVSIKLSFVDSLYVN